MNEQQKIRCFIGARFGDDVVAYAVDADGNGITSHISSDECWAKHDIGLTSDWKHEIYKKLYPDGYELVWLDDWRTDPQLVTASDKAKQKQEQIAEGTHE